MSLQILNNPKTEQTAVKTGVNQVTEKRITTKEREKITNEIREKKENIFKKEI